MNSSHPTLKRAVLVCRCKSCSKNCFQIGPESICLCGHRYREHTSDGKRRCLADKCKCESYMFILQQGQFRLRCRCKHKAVEHDPRPGPHPCIRCKPGTCKEFDSPFVCNCDCPWRQHAMEVVEREVQNPLFTAEFSDFGELNPLHVQRGADVAAELEEDGDVNSDVEGEDDHEDNVEEARRQLASMRLKMRQHETGPAASTSGPRSIKSAAPQPIEQSQPVASAARPPAAALAPQEPATSKLRLLKAKLGSRTSSFSS